MNYAAQRTLWTVGLLGSFVVAAQDAAPPESPEQRLVRHEQELNILRRRFEMQEEAASAAQSSTAQVRASATRFSIGSADGSHVLRLRATLHADGRFVNGQGVPDNADSFVMRRVRPSIEGTLGGLFDFRVTPDFAGGRAVLLDAYAVARLQPWLAVQVGKFKVPVGLERLQSAADIRFIERGLPTSLLPNRDLGVAVSGEAGSGALAWSLGYFNGVADGASSDAGSPADAESDTRGDWAARVFVQPFLDSTGLAWRGLGAGVGVTWGRVGGSSATPHLSTLRTPGQQGFFAYRGNSAASGAASNATYADGERLRITPQFHYYLGSFGLLGEYAAVTQELSRDVTGTKRSGRIRNSAWQAQFSWFVTGEAAGFRGVSPASTYRIGEPGWGALELVARVQQADLDEDLFAGGPASFAHPASAARGARSYGVGLNWYPQPSVKLSVNYDRTQFEGGAATGDRGNEHALLSRFAINF